MLQTVFSTRCAGCGAPGDPLCRTCRFALVSRHPAAGTHVPGSVLAAVPFTGRARDVLLGFKYANRRAVAGHLAGLLVNRLAAAGVLDRHDGGSGIHVVTWAPTSGRRRRGRGFDHAEAVARHVARQLGVPCRRLLERDPASAPQTGQPRAGRLHGPVFRAHPRVPPARILIVDDVVTTGATLRAATAALERAGARDVIPAAIAATPATSPRGERGEVVGGPRAA